MPKIILKIGLMALIIVIPDLLFSASNNVPSKVETPSAQTDQTHQTSSPVAPGPSLVTQSGTCNQGESVCWAIYDEQLRDCCLRGYSFARCASVVRGRNVIHYSEICDMRAPSNGGLYTSWSVRGHPHQDYLWKCCGGPDFEVDQRIDGCMDHQYCRPTPMVPLGLTPLRPIDACAGLTGDEIKCCQENLSPGSDLFKCCVIQRTGGMDFDSSRCPAGPTK